MQSIYDLVIVGAGPAGLAAALNAHRSGLKYLLLEKEDHIADTAHGYQKGKPVMAEPSQIPLRSELWLEPGPRELLLQRWQDAVDDRKIHLALNHPVDGITRDGDEFQILSKGQELRAMRVVLAIGSQGNPRRLGVSGEHLPHVFTRLTDPADYREQNIVVIGGGDSAIEVAVALAARNRVTMAVRTSEFVRAKEALERNALNLAKRGDLTIHFNAKVERIEADSITLHLPTSTISVASQAVIVKIGAQPPRHFLEKCAIQCAAGSIDGSPRLSAAYESEVPGLYVVGAAGGRADLIKHAINQGHEVVEHICGREVQPVDEALLAEKLSFRQGPVSERIQALLADVPLFAGATETQMRELLLSSQFHRLAAGQIVFHQNDYSESLYAVLDGGLEVVSKADHGPEKSVAKMSRGEFFGEMSLISGRRRAATVQVVHDALLWEIGRKAMLKFLHTTPRARELVDRSFLIHAFQTYVFPNLDYAALSIMADRAAVLKFERGEAILREGDEGDSFFFLRSGMVKVVKSRKGGEMVLAYLAAGQYFGEMALLTGEPRIASVVAIDSVEVIRLLREDFLACIEAFPDLKQRLLQEAERRRLSNVELEVRPELLELGRFMIGEEVVVGDNVLLIDETRCIHCDQCERACESVHDDGQTRIKRTGIRFANVLVANSCRHCENPLCMTDCPPGDAIVRDPRGEVYIRDNCIGCGHCATNCPYDNIFMAGAKEQISSWDWLKAAFRGDSAVAHGESKSFPVKCDLCRELKGGPACVRSCPTGAVLRLTPTEYQQTVEALTLERKESL